MVGETKRNMMTVKRAAELNDGIANDISHIFVEGFFQWLHFFSKDKDRLARAFAHMFRLDRFYVALVDGRPAGIAACTNGREPPIHLDAKQLRRYLGWYRGTIAGIVLKKELENHPYPFEIQPDTGSVEFVATLTEFRGKGVATAILSHIHEAEPYGQFVLEVADTNTGAVKLYEKMGYQEMTRVPAPHPKQSGINALVYMKWEKRDGH